MHIIKEANYPIDLKKMKANPIPKDLKKKWMKESILDKFPSSKIAENIPLSDGTYQGYFYSWILEINGVNYPTLYGVRCTKEFCSGLRWYRIKDGCAYIEGVC